MNWFQIILALLVLGYAVFLYLCENGEVAPAWLDE